MKLSEELRNKQSRDNRDLLDRAADRIDELEGLTLDILIAAGNFAKAIVPLSAKASELLDLEKGGE